MMLELLPLFNYDGKKLLLNEEISVSSMPDDDFKICSPVKFDGLAKNLGGTVEISGTGTVTLKMTCDRCIEEYETVISFPVKEAYKKAGSVSEASSSAEENPDIVYIDNTCIDLAHVLYTNMYLNIPSKHLCSDDCKGLCGTCGCNLNKSSCGCNDDTTDPRFDILDKLLKD